MEEMDEDLFSSLDGRVPSHLGAQLTTKIQLNNTTNRTFAIGADIEIKGSR